MAIIDGNEFQTNCDIKQKWASRSLSGRYPCGISFVHVDLTTTADIIGNRYPRKFYPFCTGYYSINLFDSISTGRQLWFFNLVCSPRFLSFKTSILDSFLLVENVYRGRRNLSCKTLIYTLRLLRKTFCNSFFLSTTLWNPTSVWMRYTRLLLWLLWPNRRPKI